MRTLSLVLALLVGGAFLQSLPAQAAQDVTARLSGRVPTDVAAAVKDIAHDAAARGLPVEPLIQKTLEGGAKGVAPEQVLGAVRLLAARLDEARTALRDGGIGTPSPAAVEGGADALNAGLDAGQVRDLARVSRTPYDPAVTLRVATTLTALGVPPPQGLRLIAGMIQARRAPRELFDLPNEVQVDMARGATPGEAAEALEHGEGAHGPEGEQGPQGHDNEQNHEGRSP